MRGGVVAGPDRGPARGRHAHESARAPNRRSLGELGFGKRHIAAQPTALEHRQEQVRTQILEPLIWIEPLAGFGRLQTDGSRQGQRRQQRRPVGAHREAGSLHPLPRSADVGPLRQQVRRDSRRHRDGRRSRFERVRQQALKLRAMPAEQDPKTPFGIGKATRHARQFGLRIGQAALRGIDIANIPQAALVAVRCQRCLLLENRGHFGGQAPLATQINDFEVGRNRFRQNANLRSLKIRLGGQMLSARSQRCIAVAAPEVRLVGEVRAQGVGGQVQPVRERDAKGLGHFGAEPEFVKLGAQAGIGWRIKSARAKRRLSGRKARRSGDARPRPGLINPGNGLREIEASAERRVHDSVENRVRKGLPPFDRLESILRPCSSNLLRTIQHRLRDRGRRRQRTSAHQQSNERNGQRRRPTAQRRLGGR